MALSMGGVSKAPTGNPIAPPPRPSTPGRVGTPSTREAFGPPQTASSRWSGPGLFGGAVGQPPHRIGTASGRPGTGMRPGTASLGRNLHVEERPVTQQGMAGMKGGRQGPGRQILDKSYYMNMLRRKKQEIIEENESMRVRPSDEWVRFASSYCHRAMNSL